jgi:hypothetical protein
VVKKILGYITGTLEYDMCYEWRTGNARLVGYCDSDLTSNIDTRKSTMGVLFFLGELAVSQAAGCGSVFV